jgi:hypothetical protein
MSGSVLTPTAKDQIITLVTSHHGEAFFRELLADPSALAVLEFGVIKRSNIQHSYLE